MTLPVIALVISVVVLILNIRMARKQKKDFLDRHEKYIFELDSDDEDQCH